MNKLRTFIIGVLASFVIIGVAGRAEAAGEPVPDFEVIAFCDSVMGHNIGNTPLYVTANNVQYQLDAFDSALYPYDSMGRVDLTVTTFEGAPVYTKLIKIPELCLTGYPTATLSETLNCDNTTDVTIVLNRDGIEGDFSFTVNDKEGLITGDSVTLTGLAPLTRIDVRTPSGTPVPIVGGASSTTDCPVTQEPPSPAVPETTVPTSEVPPTTAPPVPGVLVINGPAVVDVPTEVTVPVQVTDSLVASEPVIPMAAPDYSQSLPATGTSSWKLVFLALGFLLLGTGCVTVSRRTITL